MHTARACSTGSSLENWMVDAMDDMSGVSALSTSGSDVLQQHQSLHYAAKMEDTMQ